MEVVYQNSKAKVIKCGYSYEVHTVSTRIYDGIIDTDWNLSCIYGEWYCRDWMGRTIEYRVKHDPLEDAIMEAKKYE